jgi:hypothetical protein
MKYNKKNTLMIEFDSKLLDEHCNGLVLGRKGSIRTYHQIKESHPQATYCTGDDYMLGSIVGTRRYLDVEQYKFQSLHSQIVLNRQYLYPLTKAYLL